MRAYFLNFIFSTILFTININVFAQVKFYATVAPQQIEKDEYFTYKLTFANFANIDKVNFPSFSNFKIYSGPVQEKFITTINNLPIQTIVIHFVLQPKQYGNYTIEPSMAMIDGHSYNSLPVNIIVKNKSVSTNANHNTTSIDEYVSKQNGTTKFDDYILKTGEDVTEKVNQNMHLVLETNKASCFVGEPILASYNLYSRLDSESEWTKIPSFTGFSVIDMNTSISNTVQKKLDGKLYNLYQTRKAQLYPLQSGIIEINAASLENKINFQKDEKLLTQSVLLNSNKLLVNVLPLPEFGKPKDFNGAVGNFSMDVSLEKNKIASNEIGKIIISISGTGNMQLITAPKLNWPNYCEVFAIKSIDNTNQTTMPLSGTKVFEVPFAISKEGNYVLPSIAFSYFNPNNKQYYTINSKEKSIAITKANAAMTKLNSLKAESENTFFGNKFWARILLFGTFICLAIFFVFNILVTKKVKKNEINSDDLVILNDKELNDAILLNTSKNYLEKTKACLFNNNCVSFYSLLNEEFKLLLSLKYDIEKNTINASNIEILLDSKQLNNDLILKTQKLLRQLELKLFTPFERNNDLEFTYNAAQELVHEHLLI